MRWEVRREGHLSVEYHEEFADLLRAAYPQFSELFAGSRSWSFIRPELRIASWSDDRIVAGAGVLRRFLEVGDNNQLVAIVGLVAVRPHVQRTGLGLELMSVVADALSGFGVPFGVLMCAPDRVRFYRRAGWSQLSARRVSYSPNDTTDAQPFLDTVVSTMMVLPVGGTLQEWPEGDVQWHCASV